MMIVIFPCAIIDLYFKEKKGRWAGHYNLAWLLAVSIYLIDTNAIVLTGPFRALQLENGYAVVLLSLAAVAFYFLSQPLILPKPQGADRTTAPVAAVQPLAELPPAIPPGAVPSKSLEESFKERGLSEREAEVALLMAQEGLSNKEMGNRLCISPLTVRDHVTSVYRKFDVKGRAEFIAKVLNREE
jgi:DNA-binding CsgD family transcriptional regulator